MTTTVVQNLAWCLCLDRKTRQHSYARNVDLVFADNEIKYIGDGYKGSADRTIDGQHLFAIPGLVDIHSHPSIEPAYKGVREDHGSRSMYGSGLYERGSAFRLSPEGQIAAAKTAYCELLLSGVTTLVDLSYAFPGWIDFLAQSGMRVYAGPRYYSARWRLTNAWTVSYEKDADDGRGLFNKALEVIEAAESHPSGRLKGIFFPAQIDTCSEDLFRTTIKAAERLGLLVTTHIAQSVIEFDEIVRRSGKTPLEFAHSLGLLSPNCILGHMIFHARHSAIEWGGHDDFGLLSRSGVSVAHCPLPFARYGQILESLNRYLESGITVAIGTDVAPHDMLDEIRLATVLSRVADRSLWGVSTDQAFNVATVLGAKALHRDDIGGLAVGMKADVVLIDLKEPKMRPLRDPIRSLVHSAGSQAVKHVFVDGRQVVEDRKVLTIDLNEAFETLEREQQRMLQDATKIDFDHRHGDEMAPLAFEVRTAAS